MELAEILAHLHTCRWVDLTHSFGPGIPHYVGFPDEQREELFGHEAQGFLAHRYSHIGQWGTHMDPPAHFDPSGRFQDEIPVTEMILPLVVVDVTGAAATDPDLAVGPAQIATHEGQHGRIPAGSLVAINTGWHRRWPDGESMQNVDAAGVAHYPGWSVDGLRLLVEERGVTAVGHDTTDTDPGCVVSAGQLPAETYILRADRWQIELLADLDDVPATGALAVATWPKPLRGSGFPARVFAIIPETGR